MDKNLQLYFTTGEFARLCNISKHTLFHYDNIGIFSPAITADNGYRYYSSIQLEVFHVISILKELDMPLKSIKEYLDKRSPDELILLLDSEEKLIDKKINQLQKMKMLVKKKLDITRESINVDTNKITLETLPKEFLITTPARDNSNDKKIAVSLAEHINLCEEQDIYSPYSIGGILSHKSIECQKYSDYTCFYTKIDNKKSYPNALEKESGAYLVAYHDSGYHTTSVVYSKILDYANENGLQIKSCFYEDALLDELSVKGYEHYTLKISVMVE